MKRKTKFDQMVSVAVTENIPLLVNKLKFTPTPIEPIKNAMLMPKTNLALLEEQFLYTELLVKPETGKELSVALNNLRVEEMIIGLINNK